MKNTNTFKKIVLAVIASSTIISCERNSSYEDVKPSIAKIAVLNPDFSILETAAIKGGLVGVLSNYNSADPSGNYTVFAPTNEAFARLALDSENLSLLDQTFLESTLKYAVSNGSLPSGSFVPASPVGSLLGPTKRFILRGNDKYINGSKIILNDASAINGIVHGIDKVLLASGANIVNSTIAVATGKVFVKPELTYLLAAVLYVERLMPEVGIVNALATSPSLTVFAPTDQAFIDLGKLLELPAFTKSTDVERIPVATVKAVLFNHVVGGGMFTSEMNAGNLPNLNTTNLILGAFNNGVLTVKGPTATIPANMVIPDIQTTNGVVHIIDRVML